MDSEQLRDKINNIETTQNIILEKLDQILELLGEICEECHEKHFDTKKRKCDSSHCQNMLMICDDCYRKRHCMIYCNIYGHTHNIEEYYE